MVVVALVGSATGVSVSVGVDVLVGMVACHTVDSAPGI